ncbi:MAG: hypothetical protein PHU12_02020 [Candidatus Aenigmarchaeota archaeon]|nr:hypothetical protein [Candidatus Aenigmarchaeota archaeon]
MNPKTFNETMIAILLIGFAIVIFQNQMILNAIAPQETPLMKLMSLPEMQEFQNYQASIEYLAIEDIQNLAEQYPNIYGDITSPIYRVELYGDKQILVLYDYAQNKILGMFEMMSAELGQ